MVSASASHKLPPTKIHNVARTSLRAHGRTSDILAGGMMRETATGEKPILWVCDRCFKYMREGSLLELHSVREVIQCNAQTDIPWRLPRKLA